MYLFTSFPTLNLYSRILQQQPKINLVIVNVIRNFRTDSVQRSSRKNKFFRGTVKPELNEKTQTSKLSESKGLFQARNSKTDNVSNFSHIEDNPITPGILWKPFLFTIAVICMTEMI